MGVGVLGGQSSAGEKEKVLEMDGCNVCTIMLMYLMSLNYVLKNG